MSRRSLLAALSSVAVAVTTALGATAAAAAPPSDPGGGVPAPHHLGAGTKVESALARATGNVTAFVQLDTPSGLQVADSGGSKAEVKAAADDVDALAAEVVPERRAARSAKPAPQVI